MFTSRNFLILVSIAQAVVGLIVCAFRRLKKPRNREMGARGYALHSERPQNPFPLVFVIYLKNVHTIELTSLSIIGT